VEWVTKARGEDGDLLGIHHVVIASQMCEEAVLVLGNGPCSANMDEFAYLVAACRLLETKADKLDKVQPSWDSLAVLHTIVQLLSCIVELEGSQPYLLSFGGACGAQEYGSLW